MKAFATVCSIINQKTEKEIFKMAEINVTEKNFETEVLNSQKPVLVDFWASWCGPCMMLAPTIAEIAEEYSDKVKVCKINVDDAQRLALSFGVESIPTLMVFKNGKVVNTSVGGRSKEQIVEMFEDL